MQIQRRQFGEFRTRSTSLGYSLASRNRSFRYFRVSERPNGIFSTIRSKYLNASSISPRDWQVKSRRARGRTNGFWQEKCENSSAATFSRLCKPTATSFFTSCSSSGSISMTQPLSRRPDRAPVRQAARSKPLAQRSRQRWQRALDHRSPNLRLPDDGRQLAGAKRSEADAEPKAIPVRQIERRPDRVLSVRCFRIRSMHWRHHCVQECGVALRVWEHL